MAVSGLECDESNLSSGAVEGTPSVSAAVESECPRCADGAADPSRADVLPSGSTCIPIGPQDTCEPGPSGWAEADDVGPSTSPATVAAGLGAWAPSMACCF